MKRISLVTTSMVALWLLGTAGALSAAVSGDYIEVRSADVYTGPCFANSQVDLEGKQAILAWRIQKGTWQGVNLDGLSVLAVVQARATLGDPYHNPYPAKAILIVDQRANAAERNALEGFVRSEAGKLVGDVVRVETAPIQVSVGQGDEHGSVSVEAGKLVRIRTRSLCAGDHICGNEEVYYPPLVRTAHAMPAFTLEDAFHGQGLGTAWTRADARSAFVGTFAL
ncbi:MAG TPA: DUF1326 domain-containing protein [Terriglobia bacterium]|nr:DUF1326 domain-containing protein [Terriglobia bacterium]